MDGNLYHIWEAIKALTKRISELEEKVEELESELHKEE